MNNSLSKGIIILIIFYCFHQSAGAQGILNRSISFEVKKQRLDNVLEILSNKGDFYFSYNSNIVKRDSLVTLTVYNKTVRQVLDFIFGNTYEYIESGKYIIIRRAPIKISLITNKAITEDKIYTVSGYVLDVESGEKISEASIYEKKILASALTNENGYFKIKLKSKNKTAELTVSKEFYQDTTVTIQPRYDQQVTITIMPVQTSPSLITVSPNDYFAPDSLKLIVETDSSIKEFLYAKVGERTIEKTGAGKFLLCSKQAVQSLNLKKFFTERPFQLSFTPGLGTHGKLSAQVINDFSLNVLGGYSGGVNGVELGGLFNLDKKDVKYFQAAGIFNLVGGNMKGVQVAGIHNTVIKNVNGVQIAGISNHANDTVKGVQIAGIFNYAKHLKGLQIGLINYSDSSSGYSIGLINIVRKGYHKLSLHANEVMNVNATIKTGNSKLYSMVLLGANANDSGKVYSAGFGMGHDFIFSKKLSLSAEVSSQYLYLGKWGKTNLLNKASLNLNLHLSKNIALFAGPVFNVYYSDQTAGVNRYKFRIPSSNHSPFNIGGNVTGWVGWTAGITLF